MRIALLSMALIFFGCNSKPKQKPEPFNKILPKEESIALNAQLIKEENFLIDQYVSRLPMTMNKTESGLRYAVISSENVGQDSARTMKLATIHFNLRLLNDSIQYSSYDHEPVQFLIEMDNVESGLHEGITHMKTGDSARFILPYYLGHGLVGDYAKIPPATSIIIDVRLLDVKDP